MKKKQQAHFAHSHVVAAVLVTVALSGAAAVAQTNLFADIGSGGDGNTGVSSSSKPCLTIDCGPLKSSASSLSRGNDGDNQEGSSSSRMGDLISSMSSKSVYDGSRIDLTYPTDATKLDAESLSRARATQLYRGDRGCFDLNGEWVTDRTQCASAVRQAGFIDRQTSQEAASEGMQTLDAEAVFHEEMYRRFHGGELRDEQETLLRSMDAALEHLGKARLVVAHNDVAIARLADIAARIDALRVATKGDSLAPADRDWAAGELKALLDEGLAVINEAWQSASQPAEQTRVQLDAIVREMTFLIGSSPAVFELTEETYGVKVPDASFVAYVRLKSMLERIPSECANPKCPLIAEMVGMMETDLQLPLLQAMQQVMEPQEISALITNIEKMMALRRLEQMGQ